MRDAESISMTERAVLFAAVQSPPMRSVLVAQANVDWFLNLDNRRLFSALAEHVRQNCPVDALSIMRAARLRESAQFGDVVLDAEWLAQGLAESKGMTIQTFTDLHMPELRRAYQMRMLFEFFSAGNERVGSEDPRDTMAWAMARLGEIGVAGEGVRASLVADALVEELDRHAGKDRLSIIGPLTHVPWFDRIEFRLRPLEPITIAGRPGEGKSILGMQMAIGASMKCPGLVIPIEDGESAWLDRYTRMVLNLKLDNLRNLDNSTREEHNLFHDHVRMTKDRRLYIARRAQGMRTFDIMALIQHMKNVEPRLGFVVLDQMYKISDYDKREYRGETQTNAITRSVSRIVDGCNALGVCPIMLQHVAKDTVGEPEVSQISDSYIFERVSRKIILVSRPNRNDSGNDNIARVNIAKWTMGKIQSNDLQFVGERMTIDEFIDPASLVQLAQEMLL